MCSRPRAFNRDVQQRQVVDWTDVLLHDVYCVHQFELECTACTAAIIAVTTMLGLPRYHKSHTQKSTTCNCTLLPRALRR